MQTWEHQRHRSLNTSSPSAPSRCHCYITFPCCNSLTLCAGAFTDKKKNTQTLWDKGSHNTWKHQVVSAQFVQEECLGCSHGATVRPISHATDRKSSRFDIISVKSALVRISPPYVMFYVVDYMIAVAFLRAWLSAGCYVHDWVSVSVCWVTEAFNRAARAHAASTSRISLCAKTFFFCLIHHYTAAG